MLKGYWCFRVRGWPIILSEDLSETKALAAYQGTHVAFGDRQPTRGATGF